MEQPRADPELCEHLSGLNLRQIMEMRKRVRSGRRAVSIPCIRCDERGALPLSFAQQRLWLLDQREPEHRTAYNIPWSLDIRGPFDIELLQRTFAVLTARHESLRTSFHLPRGEDEPVQRIAEAVQLDIPLVELAAEEAEAYARKHATHVFDLQQAPLLKVSVLRLADQHHVLLINMHHIITDGWSMNVMSRELSKIYGALSRGLAVELPALPVQYADYACWQRTHDLQEHEVYWKKTLEGYEDGLRLPYDHARTSRRTGRAGYLRYRYPDSLAEGLSKLGHRQHATLFMQLLAGFSIVLYHYTGGKDLVVGTTTAGRELAELEQLIGFFVNVLPLRIDLSGNPTARELIERTRLVTIRALEHQALPFEHLL